MPFFFQGEAGHLNLTVKSQRLSPTSAKIQELLRDVIGASSEIDGIAVVVPGSLTNKPVPPVPPHISDMAKLNSALSDDAGDHRIHIGLPFKGPDEPSMSNPKGSTPQVTRDEYVLALPLSTLITAGLRTLMTNGLAAGEVSPPLNVEEAYGAREAAARIAGRADRNYVDQFVDVSPEDLTTLADSLSRDNPNPTAVQGAVAEALAVRYVGRQIAAELRNSTGREAFFIPGDRIRNYTYNSATNQLEGSGSQATDGVVLSPRRGVIEMHNLEIKSGTAGVATAPSQLEHHEERGTNNGLTLIEPTDAEIAQLRPYGALLLRKSIGGRPEVRVLHLQQGALSAPPNPADGRTLVVTRDVEAPAATGKPFTLRRLSLTYEEMRRLTNDMLALRGTSRRRPVSPTPQLSARAEALGAAALVSEATAAGATEADRIGRLRLRVITCRTSDDVWVGVQKGDLASGDSLVWEPAFREPSVQKVLLEEWYREDGNVPSWLVGAPPDGIGDRCN